MVSKGVYGVANGGVKFDEGDTVDEVMTQGGNLGMRAVAEQVTERVCGCKTEGARGKV